MASRELQRNSLESDNPFFSRQRTKYALAEIAHAVTAEKKPMTIYAGAGVTIDRSGLGWRGMVDGLLSQYIDDPGIRNGVFEVNSVVEVATLAEGFYHRDYGDGHYRERMIDRLRSMLYGPGDWQAGRLAAEIGLLCKSISAAGSGFILATPNYDDYLVYALKGAGIDVCVRRTTDTRSPLSPDPDDLSRPKSDAWLASAAKVDEEFRRASSVVQLHGLIPRDPSHETYAPVISELDYVETSPYTFRALRRLLSRSGLLMLGTSMTDGPLLQALERTKRDAELKGLPRFALMPFALHLDEADPNRRLLREYQIERFAKYGVTPIYVDYHFQIAQFVTELSRLIAVSGDVPAADASDVISQDLQMRSYGKRLLQWSDSWKEVLDRRVTYNDATYRVEDIYNDLQHSILDDIADVLDLSASEVLKLEVWVRDSPASHRGLRLWSSTVSRHFQDASARRARFENRSDISAVQAFVAGRPIIYTQKPDESPLSRWKTYLATPIWLDDASSADYGKLQVGAIVVASMRFEERSGLVRLRRRDAMKEAADLMVWLGRIIVSTAVSVTR